jgi:hypothetical protein
VIDAPAAGSWTRALRIACDLDGTLANMAAALQREAEQLFGPGISVGSGGSSEPTAEAHSERAEETGNEPLTDSQTRQLWAHVARVTNFWTTLPEVEPGAVKRLGSLVWLYGWEVIFLTQRPATAGESVQIQSQRWLEEHGFELPSVYVVNGSRGKIAAALQLDAVIDDRPENCLDVVAESKARALLVWRDPQELLPAGVPRLGIDTVFSALEAFDSLEEMLIQSPARPTLVKRMRKAIGI